MALSAGLIAMGVDQSTAFAIGITRRLYTFSPPPIWATSRCVCSAAGAMSEHVGVAKRVELTRAVEHADQTARDLATQQPSSPTG